MINIIDLFAGAGGLSEGFKNKNFNIICHVEMNKSACDTLLTREAFHYLKKDEIYLYEKYLKGEIYRDQFLEYIPKNILKKVLNYEISGQTLDSIFSEIDNLRGNTDINGIVGGPPCQAFSTIGRAVNEGKKSTDKRIYLYTYYVEFLKRYKPDFFLFENVKGLLSFKDEFDEYLLPKIIKAFEDEDYKVYKKVLNSSEFGVPQKRERLFIFGLRNDMNHFNFFDEIYKSTEIPVIIKDLFNDLPKMNSNETKNFYSSSIPNTEFHRYLRNNSNILTLNEARFHNSNDLEIYKIVSSGIQNGVRVKYNEIPENLRKHKNQTVFLDRFKSLKSNDVSHTIVAHISKDGHYYIHPDIEQNRSITIREAARIQSFPDNYYFEGTKSQKFIQIGNAVPPYLSEKIAFTISKIYL